MIRSLGVSLTSKLKCVNMPISVSRENWIPQIIEYFTVQYFESKKWTNWGNAILTGFFFYSDVFLPRAYRRNCFVRPSINMLSKDMSFDMIWTETFHSGH